MNRNTQRSVKLYDTLTPKQLAALFDELSTDGERDEAQRVLDAVEIRKYTRAHTVFDDWLAYMGRLSLLTASEYWRINCTIACNVIEIRNNDADFRKAVEAKDTQAQIANMEKDDAILERMNEAKAELCALLKAVKVFSEDNGFRYETILKGGRIEGAIKEDLDHCNETSFQEWLDMFNETKPHYKEGSNIYNLPKGQNP